MENMEIDISHKLENININNSQINDQKCIEGFRFMVHPDKISMILLSPNEKTE